MAFNPLSSLLCALPAALHNLGIDNPTLRLPESASTINQALFIRSVYVPNQHPDILRVLCFNFPFLLNTIRYRTQEIKNASASFM